MPHELEAKFIPLSLNFCYFQKVFLVAFLAHKCSSVSFILTLEMNKAKLLIKQGFFALILHHNFLLLVLPTILSQHCYHDT